MEKNWLIRTKSNHILGPISKEKVLELFHNGSIKRDDEVCSGNGYWFFIREDELVEKFLLGNEPQGFNPISEAKDVLTLSSDKVPTERTRDDITLVGALDLKGLKPAPAPVESKSAPAAPLQAPVASVTTESKKKVVKAEKKSAPSENTPPKKSPKKQNFLKYLGILGFVLLFLLIYYRKSIIRSIFDGEISLNKISLISSAHAQDEAPKKKSF